MDYLTQEQYRAYRQSLRDQGYPEPEHDQSPFSSVFGTADPWPLPPPKKKMREFLDQEVKNFLHGF